MGQLNLHADSTVIVAEPGRALSDLDVREIHAVPGLANGLTSPG